MRKASLNLEHKIIEVQQYSKGADSATFLFDRYKQTGNNTMIDLSMLTSKIILDTNNIIESELNDGLLVQELYNNTKIKLTWTFDSVTTKKPGEYGFQIVFYNKDETVKAYTEVGKLIVNDSLDVENIVFVEDFTLFQQWENRISGELTGTIHEIKSLEQELKDSTSEWRNENDKIELELTEKINQIEGKINTTIKDTTSKWENENNKLELDFTTRMDQIDERIDQAVENALNIPVKTQVTIVVWESED